MMLILLKTGGVAQIAAAGGEAVLSDEDIELLISFARSVPQRFPKLLGADGQPVPADDGRNSTTRVVGKS